VNPLVPIYGPRLQTYALKDFTSTYQVGTLRILLLRQFHPIRRRLAPRRRQPRRRPHLQQIHLLQTNPGIQNLGHLCTLAARKLMFPD